jgi:oligopeptide/dipeptide ABC transporter ATP-binding protein
VNDAAPSDKPLLSVRDLVVSFATAEGGVVRALDGVGFDVPEGRTIALVGESGCGKTVTAFSILRLLPSPGATIERGQVLFQGEDLLQLRERDMQRVRGGKIGMVFQEPLTALNPVYSVGAQIVEAIRLHESMSSRAAKRRAIELLHKVGFPRPEDRVNAYPHELSGGMRQRVLIAMAIAAGPRLIIADEPTSALDMALRAQIMALLADLSRELGTSQLIITHDLAFAAEIAHEMVVLYAGTVVETGPPRRVLSAPQHPYTQALVRSVPPIGSFRARGKKRHPLPIIAGTRTDLRDLPVGCRFADRCEHVMDRCRNEAPALYPATDGAGASRCFLAQTGGLS